MNKHINSFDNIQDYNKNISNILIPGVSYIEDTKKVIYDVEFTTDKTMARAGWVVYKENNVVTYYNPKSPEINSLTLSNVVGIVVIPTSHTEDGTVRIVSIDYMNYNYPTTGSTASVNMYWGGYGFDVTGLTNINKVATYVTGTTTIALSTSGRFPSDYDISSISGSSDWTISESENNSNYKYISNNGTTAYSGIPCPYDEDDTPNEVYHTYQGSILSQGLCGKHNTDLIMNMVNHQGDITNSYAEGYYPAAECCRAYKDGLWYLPSIAELGYLMCSLKEIDAARTMLGLSSITGHYFWSSSCCSSGYAWYVYFGLNDYFGSCSNYRKNYDLSVLAFVAF